MLRQHIFKENQILFVAGDQHTTDEDKEELWRKFQCAEHHHLPAGTHEKYVALARELQRAAGL
jgi:hemerythrin-like domain-containing protein